MKKNIFYKIFLSYALIIFLVSSLILVLTVQAIRNFYFQELSTQLARTGYALETSAMPLLLRGAIPELQELVRDIGDKTDIRITLVDKSGVVLADSEKDPQKMDNHGNRHEISSALRAQVDSAVRYSTTLQEKMFYLAVPLESEGSVIGVLRLSVFLRGINILLADLRHRIISAGLIAIFVALFGAFIFSRRFSGPVKKLAVFSGEISRGNFDARLFLDSRDEFRELAEGFNYMGERIKELFQELSLQKEELRTIIVSVQEGLAVLDGGGKIKLVNDSFKEISGDFSAEGKFFWEVLRDPALAEALKKNQQEKKSFSLIYNSRGKTYHCQGVFPEGAAGTVLTFYDISGLKQLEKVKKEFIANVSHELRTPLTAIKGFLETLEQGISDEQRPYLQIISRNTDRLIGIVNDLLMLSDLEDSAPRLLPQVIRPVDVLKNALRIFEPRIKQKGLELEVEIPDAGLTCKADGYKLEQMFVNLLDNAVKYTDKGRIKVVLERQDQLLKVSVADSGIGIPSEQQERIFERFYVVDKSRSRVSGGTGLGLAIVKHIVSLHQGRIEVASTPGEGSSFTVFLPLNPS